MYCFGESELYANVQGCWRLRLLLNEYRVPAVLPLGFPLLPHLPRRRPLRIVVRARARAERAGDLCHCTNYYNCF